MAVAELFDPILHALAKSSARGRELREEAMQRINELPNYNWSGVYVLRGESLVLDAFRGAPTEHTTIRVGVGVCGTAVAENRNQVVADVRQLENYLSCSVETRSEIVVLIRGEADEILGQIDIDGHEVGAFTAEDEGFLERIARILAQRWDELQ